MKGVFLLTTEKTQKQFIVCIDSDGCAMDTMDVKHLNFFGPYVVECYGIKESESFLKEWNRLNLYSLTRGINRFTGLVRSLEYAAETGEAVGDFSRLSTWESTTKSLSNQSLKEEIEKYPEDKSLQTALIWSEKVNAGIEEELAGNDRPFEGVKEALAEISEVADIAIVSSANGGALDSEWNRHGLMTYVDYVYGQEAGTKAQALSEIIEKGYDNTHVLMVGDSPGDEAAAKKNNVYFYPILFGQEKQSWDTFIAEALPAFLADDYATVNQEVTDKFYQHLDQ